MPKYTQKFFQLISAYLSHDVGFKGIAAASVAQFILESGRGSSELAREFNNFAGMKWRPEMEGYATRVLVDAPSETAYFCSFGDVEEFVKGYWRFLDRPPYDGWEEHATDPFEFIDFIAETWAADPAYAEKLKDLIGEAEQLILQVGGTAPDHSHSHGGEGSDNPCCDGMSGDEFFGGIKWEKPQVTWDPSPYKFSRNGVDVDTIVIHYTTSRSLSGTVSWFKSNPDSIAAHYVIGRDGKIVHMVKDSKLCYHGNSQNRRSIGIEHSARLGDTMTSKQERSSIALIRWLMQEYDIDKERVIGHKCAPRSTSCPGDLFADYGATANSNCSAVTTAIQKWMDEKVNANNLQLLS